MTTRSRTVSALSLAVVALLLTASGAVAQAVEAPVRVGVIEVTGHTRTFSSVFNDPAAAADVAGFRVVAAVPYITRETAHEQLAEYTAQMEAMGVEMVGSIGELLDRVDVVLLGTRDGRLHLEQALEVLRAGKPMFIDKPFAGSLEDAVAIFDAARHYGVPIFSSSSLRYTPAAQAIRAGSIGSVQGAQTHSPAKLKEGHPDLFWYGIHGVELLFTVMGTGCVEVVQVYTADAQDVVCRWADGRLGSFRGFRGISAGKKNYGGTAFGTEDIAPIGPYEGGRALVAQMAEFFRTGVPPVTEEETLEIYAFMEAAEESKRRGGAPVGVDELLARARANAAARWSAR